MATYDNLPVYKESYDLLVALFKFTKDFGKEYKYTLGESIKKEVIEMITHIYRANSVIYEVRMYNRVLTPREIRTLYNAGK